MKCQKTLWSAIFLESTGYKDVRNDVPRCLTYKYTNTNTQIQCIHKYSKWWNVRKPYEVLYFWEPLGTGMLEMMFPGVWHANTQTQIHKYSVYTNTVNDEMSVNLMKCYIFEKPLMHGCRKWYLELSNGCLTLSPLVSLM